MGFSDEAILMLTKLDQGRAEANDTGDGSKAWVNLDNYSKFMRSALVRHGNIEEGHSTDDSILYRITDKGHDALMKEVAGPAKQKKQKAKVSTLYESGNGLKPVVPADGREAINTQVRPFAELVVEACEPDECTGCVYRQVVEILAARVPGTNELVAALKLLNKAR